ncbi:hypothetical protein N665_0033s0005 [Sinapis alba]|nr:hypothetical protein N665_0033s0005 [Sinapis alba]
MSFGRKKRGYQVGKRLARRRGKPRNQDTLAMKTRHTLWSIGKHNQHERLPRKIPRAATQTLWLSFVLKNHHHILSLFGGLKHVKMGHVWNTKLMILSLKIRWKPHKFLSLMDYWRI